MVAACLPPPSQAEDLAFYSGGAPDGGRHVSPRAPFYGGGRVVIFFFFFGDSVSYVTNIRNVDIKDTSYATIVSPNESGQRFAVQQ